MIEGVKTACLYLRYSSASQTEQSIEGQLRVCREYCTRHGISITEMYIDRAKSASHGVTKRTEFLRMMADASRHPFDAVIVYKLDRFARNRYDSATYKAKLKKYGVKLISATEQLSDTPESIILESVLEGMAEFYSAELSQKIKRGIRESASKHHVVGGATPIGYKIENRHYVIDEETAPIVRETFRRYADGERICDIAKSFTLRGYRTSKGAVFTKNSFHRMLSNKRYLGYYVYKDYEEPNVLPPLVDQDTWDRVQKRVKENQHAPARSKAVEPYLLSGKLICGHCNQKMLGESGHSQRGTIHRYYTCAGRKKHRSCDKKPLPKDWIEDVVVEFAKDLLTDEMIAEMARKAVKENERILDENSEIKSLQSRQKDVELRLGNLTKAIETGIVPETILRRISELEAELRQIKKAIIEAEKLQIRITEPQVIFWLSRFKDGDVNDPDFRRQLIDIFINSVIVWDTPDGYKITTTYNIVNSKAKTMTLKDFSQSDIDCKTPLMKAYPNTAVILYTRSKRKEA